VDPGLVALRPVEVPRKDAIEAKIPLRRIGSPEAVAQAVCFLFEATYLTGVVLPVDGGRSLVD
jgi:pteridine reductase